MKEELIMKFIVENLLTTRERKVLEMRTWIWQEPCWYDIIAKENWFTRARGRQIFEKTAERVQEYFEVLKDKDLNSEYLIEFTKIKFWTRL